MNLLSLFSTDRRLLETRGSLIIRQLCLSLDSERIYCTIADILEHDEVIHGIQYVGNMYIYKTGSLGSRVCEHHGPKPKYYPDYLLRTRRPT